MKPLGCSRLALHRAFFVLVLPEELTCLSTGGRNGYGAKLCNIFSTKFTVETACKEYRHSFKQVGSPRQADFAPVVEIS